MRCSETSQENAGDPWACTKGVPVYSGLGTRHFPCYGKQVEDFTGILLEFLNLDFKIRQYAELKKKKILVSLNCSSELLNSMSCIPFMDSYPNYDF